MTSRSLSIPEPQIRVLNEGDSKPNSTESTVQISKDLQKLMLRMKGEVITEDGTGVLYDKLATSKLFKQYQTQAQGLRHVVLDELTNDEKMAFFINVYNALTIHGLAACEELPASVLKIQLFWKVTAYNIGGHIFSLDDIEHGVLRANSPHPAAKEPPFSKDDPRIKYVLKKKDPRIHFALVCGAKSCPAIQVYSAENLKSALDGATQSFCAQEVAVYPSALEIHVSRLFQWYKVDFGKDDIEVLRWTLPYLDTERQNSLEQLLIVLEKQGGVTIYYKEYNWNLNQA